MLNPATQTVVRRFTLPEVPYHLIGDIEPELVQQGYLAVTHQREIRLKKSGNRFSLTVVDDARPRRVRNTLLTEAQFDLMWQQTHNLRLRKLRHHCHDGANDVILDIYAGHLKGLVTIEYSFDSDSAARAFVPSARALREVTHEIDYQSATLATVGLPNSYLEDKQAWRSKAQGIKVSRVVSPFMSNLVMQL